MNTSNLYVRKGGDGSDTFLEAKDSAILQAGFSNFVVQYQLLCGSDDSDVQLADQALRVAEEVFPDYCSKPSSNMKSAVTDGEDEVEDNLPATTPASATSNEIRPTGTFSAFLKACTEDAVNDASRFWSRMHESSRALYNPKEEPANSSNLETAASGESLFGRGTSARACGKNCVRRHCKPRCPKPKKKCPKPRAAKRCAKPRAAKRCPKPRAAKRCPKPKPARPKCEEAEIIVKEPMLEENSSSLPHFI